MPIKEKKKKGKKRNCNQKPPFRPQAEGRESVTAAVRCASPSPPSAPQPAAVVHPLAVNRNVALVSHLPLISREQNLESASLCSINQPSPHLHLSLTEQVPWVMKAPNEPERLGLPFVYQQWHRARNSPMVIYKGENKKVSGISSVFH